LLPSSRSSCLKNYWGRFKTSPCCSCEHGQFDKAGPLKSRIFAKLCESMQKDHITLFQHTELRWLSRGEVLSRVFLLREELQLFFNDNNKESFSNFLEDIKLLLKLAY
jgi:hypothetical protein